MNLPRKLIWIAFLFFVLPAAFADELKSGQIEVSGAGVVRVNGIKVVDLIDRSEALSISPVEGSTLTEQLARWDGAHVTLLGRHPTTGTDSRFIVLDIKSPQWTSVEVTGEMGGTLQFPSVRRPWLPSTAWRNRLKQGQWQGRRLHVEGWLFRHTSIDLILVRIVGEDASAEDATAPEQLSETIEFRVEARDGRIHGVIGEGKALPVAARRSHQIRLQISEEHRALVRGFVQDKPFEGEYESWAGPRLVVDRVLDPTLVDVAGRLDSQGGQIDLGDGEPWKVELPTSSILDPEGAQRERVARLLRQYSGQEVSVTAQRFESNRSLLILTLSPPGALAGGLLPVARGRLPGPEPEPLDHVDSASVIEVLKAVGK